MLKTSIFLFAMLVVMNCYCQQVPQLFEPGFISNGGVFGLAISPDGNTALWVRSNGKRDTLVILQSSKMNGSWTKPVIASFSTTDAQWKDIDPIFSPDGKTVLFQSTRPVPDRPNRTGFDIWAVGKTATGWTAPYHLGNVINTDASESYASVTRKGDIYFMKENPTKAGNSDIYVSRKVNGVYQEPENIGLPVNTEKFRESNPFISPDEDYILYFSSDSTGYGEVDIYISFRKNDKWSSPKNLGAKINSALAEFCPFYHEKEKRLYFSRQKKGEGRMYEDLYFIDFDLKKYND
ncbi:PD40 domain-containing protein [Sediminibacterium goheungense]|uniref:WD40 repeat protein n=1 Tax=Sediminibacterium goheungense TaxID=1086393 RepID=A0A4R6IWM3_9BACT|nr:PD40 domain-containing protein [Sediminibacterium goheungense]TDO26305.1 WD40 repeat protein [Sediminibacterium goheungense]